VCLEYHLKMTVLINEQKIRISKTLLNPHKYHPLDQWSAYYKVEALLVLA